MLYPDPDWEALAACPQDPRHHAEGDVATHTRRVEAALRDDPRWRALPDDERELLVAAARWHDCGKPATTVADAGGISSHGHSAKGARLARRRLYEAGVPPHLREEIVGLIACHQTPFHALEDGAFVRVLRASLVCRLSRLALLAAADNHGRESAACAEADVAIALFEQLCRDEGCLDGPWPFPSDHSRFLYFRRRGERDPRYLAHDDTRGELVLLSGLPAAGKDTWIAAHGGDRPVISLDALRGELEVRPEDDQGEIVSAARERAREHLRAGRSFILNATSLSRQLREPWLALAADYRARVRVVYVEAPLAELLRRNRARPDSARVPERVIWKLLERWEIPELTEAHVVERVVTG